MDTRSSQHQLPPPPASRTPAARSVTPRELAETHPLKLGALLDGRGEAVEEFLVRAL